MSAKIVSGHNHARYDTFPVRDGGRKDNKQCGQQTEQNSGRQQQPL